MKSVVVATLFLFVAGSAFAQRKSIGLRIGDPLGITYKQYLPNKRAFEFGIGTAMSGWNTNYYKNSFKDAKKFDDYNFHSASVSNTVYFQGRYLFQYSIPIEGMVGKLDWYWGVGALLKLATVDYSYQNKVAPYDAGTGRKTDIDFGPEGIAGMEYTFQDIPLTLFGEISLMLEFADRPFAFRTFGAVGARINF